MEKFVLEDLGPMSTVDKIPKQEFHQSGFALFLEMETGGYDNTNDRALQSIVNTGPNRDYSGNDWRFRQGLYSSYAGKYTGTEGPSEVFHAISSGFVKQFDVQFLLIECDRITIDFVQYREYILFDLESPDFLEEFTTWRLTHEEI